MRIGEESSQSNHERFGISDLPPDSGDVTLDTCDDAIPYFVMDRKEGPRKQKNPKRGTCRARIAQTGRKGGWSASGEPGGGSASPESGSRALTRRRVRCSHRPEKRAWEARGWVSGSGALGQIGDLLQALLALDKGSSSPDVCGNESSKLAEPKSIGASDKQASIDEGAPSDLHGADDENANAADESESLSDIDDVEVDGYLHNEKEKQFKKIIWEAMNKEYLEEQAAKEAAAAAAKEAYEASFKDNPEGLKAAQELAAATAAAVAKSRKVWEWMWLVVYMCLGVGIGVRSKKNLWPHIDQERQQKRAAEAKNTVPAQTAAEATRQMLTKKRLSSKINYDVLEKLFDDSVPSENPKKIRTESQTENNDHKAPISNKKLEPEEDDLAPEDEFGYEGDTGGLYGNDLYGEGYDYDDDYGDDGYY
ncbi:hypothetical protein CK203_078004 [Vitis vinifera]|uniref:Brf1 TBP-binding domain-containing protein n=1 Tax=Vitis vinifera TaxID=29760 RepID=A0A438DHA2_VITVI|nr:hypothetical protein CK203_078004 [Vitis vinifera]